MNVFIWVKLLIPVMSLIVLSRQYHRTMYAVALFHSKHKSQTVIPTIAIGKASCSLLYMMYTIQITFSLGIVSSNIRYLKSRCLG